MKFSNIKPQQLRLYAVTDRRWLQGRSLAEDVAEALKGGATCLQLREKGRSCQDLLPEALQLKELCRQYDVPLLIDDNLELALACEADGLHIGQNDMPAGQARKLLGPGKILGVSSQTVRQAQAAARAGADYLGVGAVFPTGTKEDAHPVTLGTLQAITAAVDLPVVAIGGITAGNLPHLGQSGIAGVAVVSALFAQPDIRKAAAGLRQQTERLFS